MAAKVVLITGASGGLGEAAAKHLAGCGHRVYGTSRSAAWPDVASEANPERIPMDVTDPESVERAVSRVVEREGRLDVVVNNAGMGIAGSIEDTRPEEAQAQFETNFFGVHRVCRAVLPILRARGAGLIVNVSSIGGLVTIPYQGFYSASKYALEAMTDALRLELRAFGIDVCLIEPGDFKTGFSDARQIVEGHVPGSPYYDTGQRAIAAMDRDERNGADPQEVAVVLEGLIAARSPRPRVLAGAALQRSIVPLKRVLSTRALDALLRTNFDL